MALSSDRLTGPIRAIAEAADPLLPYRCMYRARLVAQSPDLLRVDVVPEETDGLLPPMSNIPLRTGIPGLTVRLAPGAYLLVGWENGKPTRPFAGLWSGPSTKGGDDARGDSGDVNAGAGQVLEVIIHGGVISLGSKDLVPGLNGVVTGEAEDPYTGLQQWMLGNSSQVVLAKKV